MSDFFTKPELNSFLSGQFWGRIIWTKLRLDTVEKVLGPKKTYILDPKKKLVKSK
jgi:hypothetical protein